MTTTDEPQARPKLRVDMTELTLREQRDINRTLHDELDCSLMDALQDWRQPDAVALVVWMLGKRTDPTFTRDDALDVAMGDLDLIGPTDQGEATVAANGAAPASSPESGA